MDMSTLGDCSVVVPASEEAYHDWVQQNPQGFVINAWKAPGDRKDNAMMWHRAGCDHIDPRYSTEDPPFRYVTSDMLKACSTNPAALAIWAKDRREPLTRCVCMADDRL
jgi:hypothetical protein